MLYPPQIVFMQPVATLDMAYYRRNREQRRRRMFGRNNIRRWM